MTNQRLPYSDAQSLPDMAVDCQEVGHNLHLSRGGLKPLPSEFAGDAATPAGARLPSRYDVSDDLAHLADGMELHFD